MEDEEMLEAEQAEVEEAEAEDESEDEIIDEEQRNKFFAWLAEHPKTVFFARLVLWTLCACVLPFLFIVWRFELFRKVSRLQVGGWGIIAIILRRLTRILPLK